MAETTADVRRDIEQTRERMSNTLAQLEQKLNVVQVVRDHPWPALALAFGAGLALSASGTDTKAAVATVAATKGSSTKIGAALDDIVANLMTGVHGALQDRVDGWITELKTAIGAPTGARRANPGRPGSSSSDYGVDSSHELSDAQPGHLQRAD